MKKVLKYVTVAVVALFMLSSCSNESTSERGDRLTSGNNPEHEVQMSGMTAEQAKSLAFINAEYENQLAAINAGHEHRMYRWEPARDEMS